MIRSVRGNVLQSGKGYLVIEVGSIAGGVGLRVSTTEVTSTQLKQGDSVLLQTYLQVREDALSLYGFPTDDELSMFELLLSVNGVGPRVALATLNTLTPDALRLAIACAQYPRAPAALRQTVFVANGVGKQRRSCSKSDFAI